MMNFAESFGMTVKTAPTYDTFIKQFKAKMEFKDVDDIRRYCNNFFGALADEGQEEAAVWVRNDLLQRLSAVMPGFVFNLKT